MNTPSQTTVATAAPTAPAPRKQSPWRRVAADFLASKSAIFGLAVVVLLMAAALAAPWITPQNPMG